MTTLLFCHYFSILILNLVFLSKLRLQLDCSVLCVAGHFRRETKVGVLHLDVVFGADGRARLLHDLLILGIDSLPAAALDDQVVENICLSVRRAYVVQLVHAGCDH